LVTRDESEDLRTGVTDGKTKTPSSKHFLNKGFSGKDKEKRHWKSREAEYHLGH